MSNGYGEDEEAICNTFRNVQEAVADDDGGRGGDVGEERGWRGRRLEGRVNRIKVMSQSSSTPRERHCFVKERGSHALDDPAFSFLCLVLEGKRLSWCWM